jgi:hypothetical protein
MIYVTKNTVASAIVASALSLILVVGVHAQLTNQVTPVLTINSTIIDPIEKVTLSALPDTGAEDYLMPLFFIAFVLSLAYVARNRHALM